MTDRSTEDQRFASGPITLESENSGFVMVDAAPAPPSEPEAPLKWRDRMSMARDLLEAQDYENARKLLQESLKMRPNEPLVRAMLGHCLAALDPRSVESLPLCEAAVRDARRPEMLFHLGMVQLYRQNRRKAVQAFREGLKLDPAFVPIHRQLDRIGRRKPPVVPFLSRDHGLNVVLGRWLARMGKR